MKLQLSNTVLDLKQPVVMGVLNVTPDSFSDGGRYFDTEYAVQRALEMLRQGARIIDVGGESTRPGAEPVSEQEELDRVIPVIERLHGQADCVISIDSMKPAVMDAACGAGAQMINDVYALRMPGAIEVAKQHRAAVCLMHMQGEPRTMQQQPQYENVLTEVHAFLRDRQRVCETAGISRDQIVLDPGIGFGKTLEHNLTLLANLDVAVPVGYPLLVGASRKSMFKDLLNAPADQRLYGSIAAASLAVWQGAAIVRAHDVRATVEALKVAASLRDMKRVH
ncbi:MAG: dihydropteroate synthase [Stenotrophobium sp.]